MAGSSNPPMGYGVYTNTGKQMVRGPDMLRHTFWLALGRPRFEDPELGIRDYPWPNESIPPSEDPTNSGISSVGILRSIRIPDAANPDPITFGIGQDAAYIGVKKAATVSTAVVNPGGMIYFNNTEWTLSSVHGSYHLYLKFVIGPGEFSYSVDGFPTVKGYRRLTVVTDMARMGGYVSGRYQNFIGGGGTAGRIFYTSNEIYRPLESDDIHNIEIIFPL